MKKDDTARHDNEPRRMGRKKDPRLESLISEWKKGEKERWRGHRQSESKKKR